jgi:hypothetical protein
MAGPTLYREFRTSAATFSPCRKYRYTLTRIWDVRAPVACWLLLNPSTADERKLDPTLRRCFGFSRSWGFGGMLVANIFAFRSPHPGKVYAASDPIGPQNDQHIRRLVRKADKVIVGWGVHGQLGGRADSVRALLSRCQIEAWCLGRTKDSHPKHPLYVASSTELVRFEL